MPSDRYSDFSITLAKNLLALEPDFRIDPQKPFVIYAHAQQDQVFALDLTPFKATPSEVTAQALFADVNTVSELLSAYQVAKNSLPFETDLAEARENLSDYVEVFMTSLIEKAKIELSDHQANIIAKWVMNLDIYCAVKAIESFLYSRADLKLLEIAPNYGWDVVFDHMAIRCGSQAHQDAERISDLLKEKHGYVSTQFPEEAYYQFPDGWNAYPVYKVLENGQVLRVFVDQSDGDAAAQIIQHWNRVYGYTAHHLGIRATKYEDGKRVAVPLDDVMQALEQEGIKILTPTGHYTHGLLLQVFTQPEKNPNIPAELKAEIVAHGESLGKTIENAKLLELVSRREMDGDMAQQYFALYQLEYDAANPLHSAPLYQYFLPAQAAHVIRTSQQVS